MCILAMWVKFNTFFNEVLGMCKSKWQPTLIGDTGVHLGLCNALTFHYIFNVHFFLINISYTLVT